MKVKIGDKLYNSDVEPIMIILEETEKEHIMCMTKYNKKYCVYPDSDNYTPNKIRKWMDE